MIAWLVLLQASVTIAVAGPVTSPEYLPLNLAEAEGLFAAQKLAVTLRPLRSEQAAAEALRSGRVQLAATSLDSALRLGSVAGTPPRLVLGLTAAPPVALLVNPKRAESIHGPADLAGQTIAVPAPGTAEDQALGLLLARASVPMHRVTVTSLGERGAVRALESGAVAAAVLADPYVSRMVEAGTAVVIADLRSLKGAEQWLDGPTVNAAVFARAEAVPEAPILKALGQALQEAIARIVSADPATLQTRLSEAVIGSAADFAMRLRGARDAFLPGGRVSAEAIEHSIELIKRRAPLPTVVKLPRRAESLLVE